VTHILKLHTRKNTDHAVDKCPSHTRDAFTIKTMQEIVLWGAAAVQELDADAILACGHSGVPTAGAISFLTGIPLFAVRKPGETSLGSSGIVSGVAPDGPAKRWIWWDDFISWGRTFKRSREIAMDAQLIGTDCPIALVCHTRTHSTVMDYSTRGSDMECSSGPDTIPYITRATDPHYMVETEMRINTRFEEWKSKISFG
jgi:adenine/guanine phosphoribosyltransferase-like PRPP-binding protein